MAEHPILFNGEMVRAILEGRKTQTRRVITGLGVFVETELSLGPPAVQPDGVTWVWPDGTIKRCPYGQPGDTLVPRTTWAVSSNFDNRKPTNLPPIEQRCFWSYWDGDVKPLWAGKSRPGRFLPKRLWHLLPRLPVTSVRVERVQEISEEDACAEGCAPVVPGQLTACSVGQYQYGFRLLWDSISARRAGCSWCENPWVWIVEFEQVR